LLKSLTKRLPLILIAFAATTGFFFLRDQLSFAALDANREALLAFRDANYALSALLFVLAYTVIVGLSLPGATAATLTGGFLFGLFPGVIFNVLGAGSGAILVFLAARAGLGADISARIAATGGAAARLQTGLQKNVWSALFTMRFIPAVPFFLSNLLPAFAGVRLLPFAVTTFLGIIPGALVFTSVGSGLGEVFAAGGSPDLSIIFSPAVLLPLLGLAALSALPAILRAFRRKED
jgi:uncharacterized membrane protein YdjX (TVP38/TMEM64 family)